MLSGLLERKSLKCEEYKQKGLSVMNMKKLHVEVLKMMERVRARHPHAFYGMRQRKAPRGEDRINQGFIFLGNEKYIFVPLCPVSAFPNPTATVGYVFGVEDGELVDSWLELDIPVIGGKNKSACKEDNDIYKKLDKSLPAVYKRVIINTSYYERRKIYVKYGLSKDVIKEAEEFLDKWIDCIVTVLSERMTGEDRPLIYTSQKMCKSINDFLMRYEAKDEVRRLLQTISSSLKGI